MKYKLKWQVKLGLICFIAVVVFICTGMATRCGRDVSYTAYSVREGDTVWSIAKECPGDIRENVWLIRSKNGIGRDGAIYVGDLIYIPDGGAAICRQ